MTSNGKRTWVVVFVLIFAVVAGFLALRPKKPAFLVEADLHDGRIFRIEGVTFGRNHQIGDESFLIRAFGPWLPVRFRRFVEPKIPQNQFQLEEDGIVVWLNAIDSNSRTNVDCQGIRVEFAAPDGTLFVDDHSHWFGSERFWRAGHAFTAFPRNAKTLTVRIHSWRGANSVEMQIPNPGFNSGADWAGHPLPQAQIRSDGKLEARLPKVTVATNKEEYWQSASPYWQPQFELWRDGVNQIAGWKTEWTAEDRYGNRGQKLGLTEPVLKFIGTFHPEATNFAGAVLLMNLPETDLSSPTQSVWNVSASADNTPFQVIGFFPANIYTFSDGEYLTNPPVKVGPTMGGAPSGWVSSSRRLTPSVTRVYYSHYSDAPVIYVHVPNRSSDDLIGIRLVDPQGRVYAAEREPEGSSAGILPFIIRVPPEVKQVRPELMYLPSVSAEFLVQLPKR